MRRVFPVAAATSIVGLLISTSAALAQSQHHLPSFQSGTILGATGTPYNPSLGLFPPLPNQGYVSQLPSGRTIFVAPTIIGSQPGRLNNLNVAPPLITRIGEPRVTNAGSRVLSINGSSPELRPPSGPKIIRIER
jgi:hypothetical protein